MPLPQRLPGLLIAGGTREQRLAKVAALEATPDFRALRAVRLDPSALPFTYPLPIRPGGPQARLWRIDDIELAFPNQQVGGTRLVLTQSTYLAQKLVDGLGPADRILATGSREALQRGAPEALGRRGPWRAIAVIDLGPNTGSAAAVETLATRGRTPSDAHDGTRVPRREAFGALPIEGVLAQAFRSASSAQRLSMCRSVLESAPGSPVAALACASAYREEQDLSGARTALDSALRLAPEWEAAHYEDGKYWLGGESMERASEAFRRAAAQMPTFSAAFSNLGATLGELDRPNEALDAFRHALSVDPDNVTLLNNIGVVSRELGRLDSSEEALAKVTAIAPAFVFGHYNLGHTRLLRGDFPGALAAYEEGRRRDAERNPRQGCRLAVVRLVNGDAAGAEEELWRSVNAAPADEREDLLLETYEIGEALLQARSGLAVHRPFLDRIAAELRKS